MNKVKMRTIRLWMTALALALIGTWCPAQTDHVAASLSVNAGNWTTTNDIGVDHDTWASDGIFADTWASGGRKFAFILTGQFAWDSTGDGPVFELQFSGFKNSIPDGTNITLNLSFDGGAALQLTAVAHGGMVTAPLDTDIAAWTHDLTAYKILKVDGLPGGNWIIPLEGTTPTINAMADAVGFSGASNMPAPFDRITSITGLVLVCPITEVVDFKQSGYRFVVFDRQITRKDLSVGGNSDQNTKIEVQIPQIIDPLNKKAAAFNKKIIDEISLILNAYGMPSSKFENPDNNYLLSAGLRAPDKGGEGRFLDMLPGVASFALDVSTYCNGCKPQNEWRVRINWIIAKERPVDAEDIFDPAKDWKTALLYQACTRSSGCQLLYPTDLIVEATYPGSWLLSQKGLFIEFSGKNSAKNQYEGPENKVFIPWSSLKPYLKKGGLVPGGF